MNARNLLRTVATSVSGAKSGFLHRRKGLKPKGFKMIKRFMTAATVLGMAVAVFTPAANASSAESTVGAQATKSFACASPSGEHLNVSWNPDFVSTTVYFNNHCNQKRALQTWVKISGFSQKYWCFEVNAHTSGSKKIWFNYDQYFSNVTSPASC
jgi:hypothetical protein